MMYYISDTNIKKKLPFALGIAKFVCISSEVEESQIVFQIINSYYLDK